MADFIDKRETRNFNATKTNNTIPPTTYNIFQVLTLYG